MKMKSLVFILMFLLSGFALGIDLTTAKEQGIVGEQPDGYLGIVKRSAEAESLVVSVNQKRQKAYQRIAAKNSTSVETVGKLAGKKLIDKAGPTEYVRLTDGTWVLKKEVR